MTIYEGIKTFRPKLGRPCRCMKIQGHGYESVVDCVLIISNFGLKMEQKNNWIHTKYFGPQNILDPKIF